MSLWGLGGENRGILGVFLVGKYGGILGNWVGIFLVGGCIWGEFYGFVLSFGDFFGGGVFVWGSLGGGGEGIRILKVKRVGGNWGIFKGDGFLMGGFKVLILGIF